MTGFARDAAQCGLENQQLQLQYERYGKAHPRVFGIRKKYWLIKV